MVGYRQVCITNPVTQPVAAVASVASVRRRLLHHPRHAATCPSVTGRAEFRGDPVSRRADRPTALRAGRQTAGGWRDFSATAPARDTEPTAAGESAVQL